MNDTGMFATDEEKKECQRLTTEAEKAHGTRKGWGTDHSARALSMQAIRAVHSTALAHGLPEIMDFYGMDGEGQFVTP